MNICIVTGRFPKRSETFILGHAVGLAQRGHQVTVVSKGAGQEIEAPELESISAHGVQRVNIASFGQGRIQKGVRNGLRLLREPHLLREVFPKPPWVRRQMFEAWSTGRAIEKLQPDIVHVHFGFMAGPLHRTTLSNRMIVTWHGGDANVQPRIHGELMYRELFAGPHRHTVGSRFMWRRLLELGARESSLSLIPMGVDTHQFIPPKSRRRISEEIRLICVGRLHEGKGHRYLIEAVSRLVRNRLKFSLKIIGDGPEREAIHRQIRELGVDEEVSLLGAQPARRVLDELQRADLLVITNTRANDGSAETQGVVFAEAQATGLPVVACDVGGVADSLIDGETGILCPPGDIEAIASAIGLFIQDPAKLESFGRRGRRFVETRFSLDAMLDSFEQLYVDHRG